MNCKIGQIPLVYLGIPIGGNPRRLTFCQPMLDHVRKNLSSCKSKNLSMDG